MLTRTSLSREFLDKCRQAAHEAIKNAAAWQSLGQAYVVNRRGKPMLRVDYRPDGGLRFLEQSRRDITPMIAEGLGGQL